MSSISTFDDTENKHSLYRREEADNEGNENIITITYKIKFTDSARSMASSSSNLVDSLTKCKDCDFFS